MTDRVSELAGEIARRGDEVSARLRIGVITETEPETETGHHRVRLSTTGDVWLQHDADWHPHVGDKVYAILQGPTGIVVGRLGEEAAVPPIGTMLMWAGQETAVPMHYRLCDGSLLLRADYPDLFAALGTTYGSTTSSNFRLPDLRNRFPLGSNPKAEGASGGAETHTLSVAEMPAHNHGSVSDHQHTVPSGSTDQAVYNGSGAERLVPTTFDTMTGSAGGHAHTTQGSGSAHNNMPPYLVINFIIRVEA